MPHNVSFIGSRIFLDRSVAYFAARGWTNKDFKVCIFGDVVLSNGQQMRAKSGLEAARPSRKIRCETKYQGQKQLQEMMSISSREKYSLH